jgi:two-component system sensor histidine kinase KdpD
VNRLRFRAELREQEIRSRLELANRLAMGDEPEEVLHDAERALTEIFELEQCRLTRSPDGGLDIRIEEGARPIATSDRSEIAAFVMGLGTALERVELADAVRAAQVGAAVEQSRASFLAAMTHNLRTPLATIKATLTSLRTSRGALEPATAVDLIDTAVAESDRLEQLVTKVLALSRIRTGAIAAQTEPVDVAEATQGAVQRLRVLAAHRDITLEATDGLPLVRADPALLDVVLVNLLENALRYAPTGPIEIRGSDDGEVARIEVVDHGPGIPAPDRIRVFEEFVRLPSSAPGTGIGLTIAKAFVDAQSGSIVIDQTVGGGTTVVLALPIEEGTRG